MGSGGDLRCTYQETNRSRQGRSYGKSEKPEREASSIEKEVNVLRKYMTVVLVPMVAMLLAVFLQVRVVNAGYELENMLGEASNIDLQKEILESELAIMKSPESLLSRAQELGMRFELPAARAKRVALVNLENGR